MSKKSRQSGSPEIAIRTLFHTRRRKLTPDDWERLRKLLDKSTLLHEAYRLVQRVYGTHDKEHLTPHQARCRVLKAWTAMSEDAKKFFPKFRVVVEKRGNEYSNNWAQGAQTNGVTEAKNRVLRDIQRAGRGLRFKELRLRAIYSASPTERMMRAKLGGPDPIDQALALIRGEDTPKQVRTVTRHGLHKPGRRPRKQSAKQMDLFLEWT